MIISNAGRTRLVLCAAAGIVLGAVLGATVTGAIAAGRQGRRAEPARGGLAPDPAAMRYRYATDRAEDSTAELATAITALEARAAAQPSPFDDAELADLYLRRAQQGGDPQGYQAAEAMARRSLERLPAPNPALLTLARLAEQRHDFREAIELAHRHRGRSSSAQVVIATSYLALGELPAAVEAAHAAVAIKPDSAAYLMRALVLSAQGRDPEAALDFASAVRVEEPGDLPAAARLRALWGRFLLRRGETAGAARLFDEALRIAPGFALATAYRGELALRTGDAREAARRFERAFIASRQVRYLIDQARAQELTGDPAGADALRAQVEAIIRGELGAGGLGHRLDLAEVLIDRGGGAQLAEAIALAREEAARRGSWEVRFQLARALARSGAGDAALREVQAALASGAREAQLYALAADLEARLGNTSAAALYTRLADQLDPGGSGWRTLGLGVAR